MKHTNSDLAFAERELGVIASALREYSQACLLDAEMTAGRDEIRRRHHLQRFEDAQLLLARIGRPAA